MNTVILQWRSMSVKLLPYLNLCTAYCTATKYEMVNKWEQRFKRSGIEDSKTSAYYLIDAVTTGDNNQMILDKQQIKDINIACYKRLKRMPVQYIIGQWQFRTVSLIMRQPVFIPRPETEDLVDLILNSLSDNTLIFLDMCTGSGPLCVSLCQEHLKLIGYATDISPQAVQLAKDNTVLNNVSDRITVLRASINDTYHILKESSFDFIVSNPPYIPTEQIAYLQPEIIQYEDHRALDGGTNGLTIIKQVLHASRHLLKPHGYLWLETGLEHNIESLECHQLFYKAHFPDFTGRNRFHLLQKCGK